MSFIQTDFVGVIHLEIQPAITRPHPDGPIFTTQDVIVHMKDGQQLRLNFYLEKGCLTLAAGALVTNELPAVGDAA